MLLIVHVTVEELFEKAWNISKWLSLYEILYLDFIWFKWRF